MAKAFKCDRCGKYFDEYEDCGLNSIPVVSNSIWDFELNKHMDLCIDCVKSLADWIEIPKKTEQVDFFMPKYRYRGTINEG